jgi:HEAT repeat protein
VGASYRADLQSDGEIEFTFDVVRPVRLKGNINDSQIQKVLAHALVNSQNPGVRLRTVNALSGQQQPLQTEELRAALLEAITSDANPAVRKEALTLLQKLPFDEEVKKAILHVLQNDQNSGVRIAAMMVLDQFKAQAILKDQEVLNVLREKMETDENNYIRLIARNFLEEKQ